MTLAQAQAAAATLRECLLDNGVRQVSIELQTGVAGSGYYVGTFKRGLGHHIASYRSQGLTPGLATVKNGRSDLVGPLANCYGGFDRIARIITLGWANHPGLGGPWSVPGWGTIPTDNGRPYLIGWEFEGGYLESDWPDEMHEFMARCGAGTLDYLGTLPGNPGPAPLECWGEHKTWAPLRKIDRLGYTTASGRARIAAVRGAITPTIPEGANDMQVYVDDRGGIYLAGGLAGWQQATDPTLQSSAWQAVFGQAKHVNDAQADKIRADMLEQRRLFLEDVVRTLGGTTPAPQ